MTITAQEALLRCIEHREIFHDEMLGLMRAIMKGEISPTMTAALLIGLRTKKELLEKFQRRQWLCVNLLIM
jgi:anthranilate phosphoribosyltransferase